MGYTTEFTGQVKVEPPLNPSEIDYLRQFAATRHMKRARGPYYVGTDEADVSDQNNPPAGQPGLWCSWEPTDDGTAIEWNEMEKFYDAQEWMRYLVDHFLKPDAYACGDVAPQFANFTFDHVVNGTIDAEGEERDDVWQLVVTDNIVTRIDPPSPADLEARVAALERLLAAAVHAIKELSAR